MFAAGKSTAAIAKERDLNEGTITGHLALAIEAGFAVDTSRLVTAELIERIRPLLAAHGSVSMKPIFDELGGTVDYGRIKIACALIQRGGSVISGEKPTFVIREEPSLPMKRGRDSKPKQKSHSRNHDDPPEDEFTPQWPDNRIL